MIVGISGYIITNLTHDATFAHAALTCQGHNNPPTEHPFDTVGIVFPFQYFLLHTLFDFEYL